MAGTTKFARRVTAAVTVTLLLLETMSVASAAPGDEDTTFNTTGVKTFNVTNLPKQDARVNDVAVQSDGKIIAVGYNVNNNAGDDTNFLVARYNTNGSLDATYANQGIGTSGTPGGDVLYGVTLDSSDRALVVGIASGGHPIVARVNPNGVLDTGFGSGGATILSVPGAPQEALFRDVRIDGSGRIVAAGYGLFGQPNGGDFLVARFTSSGQLDPTFDGDGIAIVDIGSGDVADGLAIQPDGKIVVGGAEGLVRLTDTGSLDNGFAGGGKASWFVMGWPSLPTCTLACGLALDGSGIVFAGQGCDDSCGFLVRRATFSGAVDTTFGGDADGQVSIDRTSTFPPGGPGPALAAAHDVVIGAGGRIIAAGYGGGGSGAQDMMAAQFTSSGVVDTSFGSSGVQLIHLNGDLDEGMGVALDGLGNVVVGGHFADHTAPFVSWLGMARLLPTGAPDTSFDSDGVQITPVSVLLPSNDYIGDVAVGPAGNIITAGASYDGPNYQNNFAIAVTSPTGGTTCCAHVDFGFGDDTAEAVLPAVGYSYVVGGSYTTEGRFAIAKVLSTGALDTSFDGDGKVTTSFPGLNAYAYDAAVDSSGRLVAVGGDNGNLAMARYNPDGSLDATFGTGGIVVLNAGTPVRAVGVAFDSVGRILVAVNDNTAFNVARFTTAGTLDSSFGSAGRAFVTAPNARTVDLGIDSSGRVLVAGTIFFNGHWRMAAARFTGDGALDAYGTNGLAIAAFGPTTDDTANAAIVDPLGRITIVGDNGDHIAAVRLTATGAQDGGYGVNGWADTPTLSYHSSAYTGTIDGDGRLIAAGYVTVPGYGDDSIIVRYQAPPPDTTTGTGTASTGSDPTPSDPVETSVTNPTGGSVTITEETITASTADYPAPTGYTLLDQQVTISTPATNDPNNPLVFTFLVDASELTAAGVDIQHLEVLRNGVPVPNCTNPTVAVASPDPCVYDRHLDGNGDGHIGVYTSAASAWTFAKKVPVPATSFSGGVKLPPNFNTAKAGTAVPLKFTLGGDFGPDIFAIGYPKIVDCNVDPLSAGSPATGVLTYDSTTQRYTYAWKTPKSFAGNCRQIVLRFKDGSILSANYNFTK